MVLVLHLIQWFICIHRFRLYKKKFIVFLRTWCVIEMFDCSMCLLYKQLMSTMLLYPTVSCRIIWYRLCRVWLSFLMFHLRSACTQWCRVTVAAERRQGRSERTLYTSCSFPLVQHLHKQPLKCLASKNDRGHPRDSDQVLPQMLCVSFSWCFAGVMWTQVQ